MSLHCHNGQWCSGWDLIKFPIDFLPLLFILPLFWVVENFPFSRRLSFLDLYMFLRICSSCSLSRSSHSTLQRSAAHCVSSRLIVSRQRFLLCHKILFLKHKIQLYSANLFISCRLLCRMCRVERLYCIFRILTILMCLSVLMSDDRNAGHEQIRPPIFYCRHFIR